MIEKNTEKFLALAKLE